jgi:hypothetical protein
VSADHRRLWLDPIAARDLHRNAIGLHLECGPRIESQDIRSRYDGRRAASLLHVLQVSEALDDRAGVD